MVAVVSLVCSIVAPAGESGSRKKVSDCPASASDAVTSTTSSCPTIAV